MKDLDPTSVQRKKDHIEMAFEANLGISNIDDRFYYEPILNTHPDGNVNLHTEFVGKRMKAPIWVSSMTGGTDWARIINRNLAQLCGEFGFGMGLGSCRSLLENDAHLDDFDVRNLIGDFPLYANLGIAQLEKLIEQKSIHKIKELVQKLQADGIIIHVNPLQEWLQPEGDKIKVSPIISIKRLIDAYKGNIIVKEVGQGMGINSLRALFKLPLAAIDLAANGGTNFSKLELMRSSEMAKDVYKNVSNLGHSAAEMVDFCNQIKDEEGSKLECDSVIISGGIKNFLDGYYFINKIKFKSIYAHASSFLKYARGDYGFLKQYAEMQVEGLKLSKQFLTLKK